MKKTSSVIYFNATKTQMPLLILPSQNPKDHKKKAVIGVPEFDGKVELMPKRGTTSTGKN